MAKVMLVEDDNNLREIYEARLQAEGYTIVTAKDGEEALVVAKAEKPDLVIADVMMPKISGFEMLDILRNTDGLKNVKVIMLTALGQADDQQRADKLGADRYLVKSQVTLEDIVEVARQLLGGGDTPAPPEAATPAAPVAADNPAPAEVPVTAAPPETPAAATAEATAPASAMAPTPITVTEAPAEVPEAAMAAAEPAVPSEPSPEAAPASQAGATEAGGIEKLVPGASEEAPAPGSSVSPTTPAPAASDADDKLMSEAVNELVAATPGSGDQPASAPPPTTVPEETAAGNVDNADRPGGAKKVIAPLDSQPKSDINALLAAEEAKEAAAKPADSSAEPKDKPSIDPNSIAL